jgi:hypothetical protein
MLAADKGLRALPWQQNRERLENRSRLVQLYETIGRTQQADAYR